MSSKNFVLLTALLTNCPLPDLLVSAGWLVPGERQTQAEVLAVLRNLYAVFHLLHGTIRELVDQSIAGYRVAGDLE